MMKNIVTVVILGAGDRGREVYGQYILEHPGDIKVVAIAELDKEKRKIFAKEHNIAEECRFDSWEQLLDQRKLADGIIISIPDNMHAESAIRAMEKGYKILLEKPIAPNLEDTLKVVRKANETSSKILVAHVLRYTNFYEELKRLLKERVIGDIRFVDHIENIGFYHFAHGFVRGNWRNTDIAAPIILAKSCHDMDLIYWLLEKKCIDLSSHASLEYFTSENQPRGASNRCLACTVEADCPYSARKIYLTKDTNWPVSVITTDLSYEGRYKALEEGPYGRCVYSCDNNVPEVQTVRMRFEDNIEVNFALTAFSNEKNRTSKIFGTGGEIRANFEYGIIEVYKFAKNSETIMVSNLAGGHSGGDSGLMNNFVRLLKGEIEKDDLTTIEASLESHVMAFAAEVAREEGIVVNLDKFRRSIFRERKIVFGKARPE